MYIQYVYILTRLLPRYRLESFVSVLPMSFSFTVAQRENRSAFLSNHGVIIRLLLLLFTLYIIYYTRHDDDAVVLSDIALEQFSLCSVNKYIVITHELKNK